MENNSPFATQISSNIQEFGWHMFQIFGSDTSAPFYYTIGLTEQDLPEIIIVGGMSPQTAHGIVKSTIDKWQEEGEKLGVMDDLIVDGNGNGLNMLAREVKQTPQVENDYAVQLFNYYQDRPVRLVQLLWPDEQNRLPTHKDFSMHHYTEILPPLVEPASLKLVH